MSEDPAAVAWDEAYNATDSRLIAIEGLIHAARIVVEQHPALGGPEPETAALREVLRALVAEHDVMRADRSTEFRAGLALAREIL